MFPKRPYFGFGQTLGLMLLLISYAIGWYSYVLIASNYSSDPTSFWKPTAPQWFGLLVTSLIAALAFLTYWLSVQGSPTNLENNLEGGQINFTVGMH